MLPKSSEVRQYVVQVIHSIIEQRCGFGFPCTSFPPFPRYFPVTPLCFVLATHSTHSSRFEDPDPVALLRTTSCVGVLELEDPSVLFLLLSISPLETLSVSDAARSLFPRNGDGFLHAHHFLSEPPSRCQGYAGCSRWFSVPRPARRLIHPCCLYPLSFN